MEKRLVFYHVHHLPIKQTDTGVLELAGRMSIELRRYIDN